MQRLAKADEEVGHHLVSTVRLKELLEVEKLLDHQVGAERLRGVEHLLSQCTRLVWFALTDEHGYKNELPKRSAPGPVAWTQGDDPLSLTLGFGEVTELTHAACGLAGERALVKAANPW
jgi:hypothetical protein